MHLETSYPVLPSPVQPLEHPLFKQHGVRVFIKRDDLIHPIISGNKWRKLKGNLAHAKALKKKGVLTFGGAYSNHIHALAYACQQQGLASIGIIRGEEHYQNNYTLRWAKHWGMKFNFVDRTTYRKRHEQGFLDELSNAYPDYLIVPEGGSNSLALSGMAEVMTELSEQQQFDTLMLPVGSGGSIAGLLSSTTRREANTQSSQRMLGVAVLKNAEYLVNEIEQLVNRQIDSSYETSWQLLTHHHCGGYAKYSAEDANRLADIVELTGVPFEPVYSGKMMLALFDLLEQGYFTEGHTIMLLHTGGLQGIGGQLERNIMPERLAKALQSHLPSAPQVQ